MPRRLLLFDTILTDPLARDGVVRDGAILLEGSVIKAIGPSAQLRADCPDAVHHDYGKAIAMPGFINAHDHGRGLSPRALGLGDDLLEPWIMSLMVMPALDPATDTALSAVRQLQAGITTTVNSYYDPALCPDRLQAVRDAYARAGIGAQVIFSAMDRPPTTELLRAALGDLPPELAQHVRAMLDARRPFDQPLFDAVLREAATTDHSVGIMAGVVAPHWSSDAQLRDVAALADSLGLAAQMHLLESHHQAAQARQFPGGIVAHLGELGVLGRHMSCAHAVHLSAPDIAQLARHGASVVHNASSNLRLRSGLAPIPGLRAAGVTLGLGLDSMGLHDMPDMFAEMRLVHALHGCLSAADVLAMATQGGADALGLGESCGRLTSGRRADIVVLDGDSLCAPGLMADPDLSARILFQASNAAIRAVYVGGQRVIDGGAHASVDVGALEAALIDAMQPVSEKDRVLYRKLQDAIRPFLLA